MIFLLGVIFKLLYPHVIAFLHLLDQPCIFLPFFRQLVLQLLAGFRLLLSCIPIFLLELARSLLDLMQKSKLLDLRLDDLGFAEGAFSFCVNLFEDDVIGAGEAATVL
jgi:hypothetical protein